MLWQLLASFSSIDLTRPDERGVRVRPLCGVLFSWQCCICVAFSTACAVSNEELGGSRSVSTGMPGALIAPPVPAGGREMDSQASALGRRFLEDPDASIYQYDPVRLPSGQTVEEQRQHSIRARSTDAEIAALEGGLGSPLDRELARIERDLDLETTLPADKVPSFTAGTKKVKSLFKRRHFEDALVETNYLLEFYPRSPQLLMMKGTLHQKLDQIDLALSAYREAYFIRPHRKLHAQIRYLEMRIADRERLRRTSDQVEGVVTPGGVEKIESIYPGFDDAGKTPPSAETSGAGGSGGMGDIQAVPGKGN